MSAPPQTITLDELENRATTFAASLRSGDRVCLSGPLGSGKTTFLFHVTQALGLVSDSGFSSPTFSVHNQYDTGRFPIHHLDLYRLETFRELETLDLLPLFEQNDAVVFVEWGDKFPELSMSFNRRITFAYHPDQEDSRLITFQDS